MGRSLKLCFFSAGPIEATMNRRVKMALELRDTYFFHIYWISLDLERKTSKTRLN